MSFYPSRASAIRTVVKNTTVYNTDGTVYSSQNVNQNGSDYVFYARPKVKPPMIHKWRYPSNFGKGVFSVSSPIGSAEGVLSNGRKIVTTNAWMNAETLRGTSYGTVTTPAVPLSMVNRAKTEVLNKISDSKFNVLVTLAESRQTLGLLSTQMLRLLRAWGYFKSGRLGKALKTLGLSENFKFRSKDISSKWLEIQFGWGPLLQDIYGLYEITKAYDSKNLGRLIQVQRVVRQPYAYSGKITACSYTWKGLTSVKYKLWFTVESPSLAWASSLGLLNPALVVWEKVKFSFVIDWLIPVGNLLQSYTDILGLKFHSGFQTQFTRGTGVAYNSSYPGISQEMQYRAYVRTSLSNFPLGLPYIKSPFSGSHITSALALFRQFRR